MIEQIEPWEDKVWGSTRRCVLSPVYSLHELILNSGGYCSLHYHMNRANRFTVISGFVRIVWCYGWEVHEVCLEQKQWFMIKSQVPHQFQVLVEGKMLEEYVSDQDGVQLNDIVRLSIGGKVDAEFLRGNPKSIILEDGTVWKGGI